MSKDINFLFYALMGLAILSSCVDAPSQSAQSIRWVDGDSGEIDGVRFRLADVDAPETGPVGSDRGANCEKERAAGRASRDFMRAQTRSGEVTFHVLERDQYDRLVIEIMVDNVSLSETGVAAEHLRPWPHVGGRPTRPKPDWCAT